MLWHSRWPALNDKPSGQAACLPAKISQIRSKQGKFSIHLSKGSWETKEGTIVILSVSNDHIPIARVQAGQGQFYPLILPPEVGQKKNGEEALEIFEVQRRPSGRI